MLDFKPIEINRINEYRSYYDRESSLGCEANFANGFLWSEEYLLRVTVVNNTLIKAYFRDDFNVWGYCMPRGNDVVGAVEAIFADAAERGGRVLFAYMSQYERDMLEKLFPNRFRYEREPNNQDYIYLSKDLATLAGKKFHAKRNHISKFYRTYGDSARFATLDEGNVSDALCVMRLWCEENGIDPSKHGEYAVFQKACSNFDKLKMLGAVIYVDEKPVAVTIGNEISPRCFDVIFEKALREYDGIYAVINNEFAKMLTKYEYINREEDLGIEGLRKAKLSYNPVMIYDRYSAFPL